MTPSIAPLSGFEVEDESVETARIMKKIDRHLIPWFFSLGVCCYLDRTNLAFAAVQLSQHLGLSCATYGLGAGLFFLGYSFQVPSNMMLARLGAPTWLSIMVIVWGCVAAAFAFTNSTTMFLILRVALGLAECGTFPGIWTHLSRFYTPRELGPAYAAVTTSTALAQVIGAPLAALILSFDGAFGLEGWQWLFIIEGVTTLIFGVLLKIFLAPSPATATCLTPEERKWLQRRQDGQPTASNDNSFRAQLRAAQGALKNWRVWYMSAIWMTITQSMYGIIFFAPMMIKTMFSNQIEQVSSTLTPSGELIPSSEQPYTAPASTGCSTEHGNGVGGHDNGAGVALLSMAPFAAAAGAMILNAKLAEAANERHRHAGIPILMGSFFMALTPVALHFVAPVAGFLSLVLAAACVWAFHGPFMSWPATFLKGHEASVGFAIINSLGSFGGFIGPLLLGVLADKGGSYDTAISVLAVMLGMGGVGIIMFPVGVDSSSSGEFSHAVRYKSGQRGGEEEEEGLVDSRNELKNIRDGERMPILSSAQRNEY